MTRYQIAEMYMVLGGIPFYWKHLEPNLSADQNVDDLFFARSNKLEGEDVYNAKCHNENAPSVTTPLTRQALYCQRS